MEIQSVYHSIVRDYATNHNLYCCGRDLRPVKAKEVAPFAPGRTHCTWTAYCSQLYAVARTFEQLVQIPLPCHFCRHILVQPLILLLFISLIIIIGLISRAIGAFTLQAIVPILCYLPTILMSAFVQTFKTEIVFIEYLMLCFGALPSVIDPLITIYFVPSYRKWFKEKFLKRLLLTKVVRQSTIINSHEPVFNFKVRSITALTRVVHN
ncbi:unnamed protein product [Haemonchus placei]|uniref:G_PROTEIN_RECEP_F1_2 domain-containing protein n=1 Tax=Haemonchus placei TaxID=6290 RepID=A0A0N4X0P1_HAEPC|nr:unnamed protein product [Haemonchus placei]